MRFNRRTILSGAIAAAILVSHPATAQSNFPTKPITIIVPAAAGGPTGTSGSPNGDRVVQLIAPGREIAWLIELERDLAA